MTRSVTIRDVPDETVAELASRAAASGRSLQEYLRARLIREADVPDVATVVARIRSQKAAAGTTFAAADILADLDADRR